MSGNVIVPTYPNVPDLPGVPTLLRDPAAPVVSLLNPILTADTGGYLGIAQTPTWGIFLQTGDAYITGDTVASVEMRQDNDLPTYPVEGGGFSTYNKVVLPKDIRIIIAKGGSVQDKQAFLTTVDAAVASTDLYQVVTPEASYLTTNLKHYSYSRTSKSGVGLMTVEIWAQEIRITATQSFTNTQSASGADTTNSGPVQTQTPSSAAIAAYDQSYQPGAVSSETLARTAN